MRIAIIADDLTGANDTAVAFARRGFPAATVLTPVRFGLLVQEYDVIAVSTESRALPPDEAYAAVRAVAREMAGRLAGFPGTVIYKKIDSALRGPVAAELHALLDALPRLKRILIAPAFPAAGRTTVDGEQRLDGRPVHLTPMADDPINPVRVSHIPALFEDGGRGRELIGGRNEDRAEGRIGDRRGVHRLRHSTVAAGVDAVRAELRRLSDDVRFIVADAVCDADLDVLAQLVLEDRDIAPCGSAGLAAAIARRLAGGREAPVAEFRVEPGDPGVFSAGPTGGLLLVVGSKSPKARSQLRALFEGAPWVKHVPLPLERLSADRLQENPPADGRGGGRSPGDAVDEGADEVLDRVSRHVASALAASGACALYPDAGAGDVARAGPSDPESHTDRAHPHPKAITRALATVTQKALAEAPAGTLFLAGGETAVDVLTGLGAEAMDIETELWPGVAAGRIIGGSADGARVITKAGSFGDDGLLVRLVTSWREARERAAG